jgi:hypothetical protein
MYATLHITKAQDAEWNAFAKLMLDNAHALENVLQPAALEVLYAGLSPDQKRMADEWFRNDRPKSANGSNGSGC